jgi:pimeloyl-ACP methyl ester carboxylesterase
MINTPQINYVTCRNFKQEYRMFYTAWGNQEECSKTLICIHGLNRNGRDWDYIGNYFSKHGYYVIAPDIVGRGNSDYLKDPMQYDIPFYVADIFVMIQTLGLTNIDFIGTSMGGLIGMAMAAMSQNPIRKMALNDIGAEIERAGLARISGYSAKQPDFDTYTLAKDYLINISRDFGDLPENVWDYYALNSLQKNSAGKYELKRDVNLFKPLAAASPSDKNLELWPYWDKIKIPTLVIRGEHSDILSQKTVDKMWEINPNTQTVQVNKAGHAPYLYSEEHFSFLDKFLNA